MLAFLRMFKESCRVCVSGSNFGSTTIHRRGILEATVRCCSSYRKVFSAGDTPTSGRPEDSAVALRNVLHARKNVVHSPVDPVALRSIWRAGFSAPSSPAGFVLWRDLSSFWTARRKLDVLTRRDRQRSQDLTVNAFQTAWVERTIFSKMWGLAYRLSGRPVGPKKRVYVRTVASKLGGQEWSEFLSLPGYQGSSAQVVNRHSLQVSQRLSWQKAWFLGGQDYVERAQRARSFHVRKAVPSWAGSPGILEDTVPACSGW